MQNLQEDLKAKQEEITTQIRRQVRTGCAACCTSYCGIHLPSAEFLPCALFICLAK